MDLKDDPAAIAEYGRLHRNIWPEIARKIQESGITGMQIYRVGNRLFMVMETKPGFSFADKAAADEADPLVQQWEALMGTFQQSLPMARPGEKWVVMSKIFDLTAQSGEENPEAARKQVP